MSHQEHTNQHIMYTNNSTAIENSNTDHKPFFRKKDKKTSSGFSEQKYFQLEESNEGYNMTGNLTNKQDPEYNRGIQLTEEAKDKDDEPKRSLWSGEGFPSKSKFFHNKNLGVETNNNDDNPPSGTLKKSTLDNKVGIQIPMQSNNKANPLTGIRNLNFPDSFPSTERVMDDDYPKSSDRFGLISLNALTSKLSSRESKDPPRSSSNSLEENEGANSAENPSNNNENYFVPETPQTIVPQPTSNNNTGEAQIPVQDWQVDISDSESLEERLSLYSFMVFFLALGAFSVILLLVLKNVISHQALFYVIYTYLAYSLVEIVWRHKKYTREDWRVTEDWLCASQFITGAAFIIVIDLKFRGIISTVQYSYSPFMLNTILYAFIAKGPTTILISNVLTRTAIALQALLLSLKLDGFLEYDWEFILIWTWLLLGYYLIYFVGFVIILIFLVIDLLYKRMTHQPTAHADDIIGMIWFMLVHTYALIGLYGIFGVGEFTRQHNSHILQKTCIASLILLIFVLPYTVITFKRLVEFLHKFNLEQAQNLDSSLNANLPTIKPEGKLEVQQKESYFIMLSPTYYLPLRNKFLAKDQASLTRAKKVLENLKSWRTGVQQKKTKSKPIGAVNVKTLKEYKTTLDAQFSPRGDGIPNVPDSTRNLKKKPVINLNQTTVQRTVPQGNKSKASMELSSPPIKPQFSFNDLDNIHMMDSSPTAAARRRSSADDDDTCYICCINMPNAIMMNCGHAGVCYECAEMLIKKDKGCTECRSKIEAIIKIDPNPKFSNIIKGLEVGTIAQPEVVQEKKK